MVFEAGRDMDTTDVPFWSIWLPVLPLALAAGMVVGSVWALLTQWRIL